MDKIIARGLVFWGYHGVLLQEKNMPQKFIVDLELSLDLKEAAANDDLSLTVDYSEVFYKVKGIVENKSYNLIEALAVHIADTILAEFLIQEAEVTVYKPDAPVQGTFEYFAVKVKRFRK